MKRPPLSTGRTYNRGDLRRQLDWFETRYGMSSQEHCDRRDVWVRGDGPSPLPSMADSSAWDGFYHEWLELGPRDNG